MKGGRFLKEPTGIWVVIVPIWPVIRWVFIIPIIILGIGNVLWAILRSMFDPGLKTLDNWIDWLEEAGHPISEVLYLCLFLGGFSYLSNATLHD